HNVPFDLYWSVAGSAPQQCKVAVINSFGQTLFTKANGVSGVGQVVYSNTVDCLVPECDIAPTNVTITNVTTSGATVNWVAPATTSWDICVLPAGSPAPTLTTPDENTTLPPIFYNNIVANGTNPNFNFDISGLSPDTPYNVYVRVNCSPEHSPWSTVTPVTTVPTCPKPTIVNTSVTGITTTSATFDWTNGSATDTKWQILLIPSDSATLPTVLPAIDPIANPVSGQKFQIVDATLGDPKPFTINGLDPAQIYFYYIRTVCSDDNISTWAGPIYFNTVTCDVANKCSYKFLLTNTAGNSWNNGRMQVLQNGILIQTLGATLVNNANGVSIPLCHNEAIQLFWSVAGTAPENIGITIISPFNDIIYTKPAGTGTPLTMLYNQLGNCTPPTCPKPLPLAVNPLTIGTTTAQLTWTEQSAATQWEVFVTPFGSAPPVNYTPLLATSSAPTAGNGGFYYLADLANGPLPFTVTGLSPSTVYQYYVRAICSSTDISTWTILNPIKFITKPINDECENAINALINPDWACNPSLNNPGNTLGATGSLPTITGTGCGTTDDDVWYKFTATSTAHVISLNDILPTPNTATVTLNHMVLSGVCGTLVKTYCSTDTQSVATGLVVGQTYYIRVYTAGSTAANSATFNLCIGTPPPPATNDECATALPAVVNELSECLLTTPGNIIGATASTQAIGATNATNNPCFGTANDDVWFTFVANSGTEIVSLLNIEGTTTNLNHAIYSGTCGNLVRLNCSADNTTQTVTKNLVVGNTYYIRIWSNSSASQVVTFDLCVKPVSSCQNAAPFCGADVSNPYIYANTTGLLDTSQVACLGSIPNPTFYTLRVDQTGDLSFTILQNTSFDASGNPNGANLDVDFVAWGPFDSPASCSQIAFSDCPTCPNNTTNQGFYPFGNIVDCSYDASFTETLTINGAVAGQYYIILVTNFSDDPGLIRLVQTNFGEPQSGTTVCCDVDLGPDKEVCGNDVELNALEDVIDLNNVPGTYQWFLLPSTTPIPDATGPTYTATQSGTYKVQGACGLNPVDDEIIVVLSPPIVTTQPSDYRVCDDASNDGIGQFDLQTLTSQVLGSLDPALYTVSYHLTSTAASSETSVGINTSTLFSSVSTTIYVRVESNALETCYAVQSVNLVVTPLPAAPTISSITECEEDPIQTLIPVVPDGVDVEWFDAPVGGNIVLNPSWNQLGSITFYAESISPNLDFENTNPVTVTIPAGQTSATFTVPTLADSTTELPETFTVIGTITSGNTANISSPSTGVINDTVAERIVNIAQPLILEGSPAIFNISISNPSDIDTVIDIETSNLTADLTDYTPPTVTSVTIPAGQTNVSISIPTLADAIAETDEQFQLKATVTSGNTTNVIVFANAIITETVSQPSLIVYGSNTVEGNLATFNLCLTAPSSVDTVIVFNTSSGTAGTLGCRSATRTAVTLEIKDTPDAPASGGDIEQCVQSPIQTLTATATPPSGATVVWYDSETGGAVVPSPTLNSVGTVTYYAESDLAGCLSPTRTAVKLTIAPLPLAPISGGNQSVCESNPIQTLTATATVANGDTFVWYDAATGGNIVTNPTLNTISVVTYYAEAVGPLPTQCVNPTRTAVTLEIKDTPAAPASGGDIEKCVQSPIQTLTATATPPSGATVVWYDALTGGNIVTSPTLNTVDSITYYAESELNGCFSTIRTPVKLTITDVPKFGIQGDCLGNDFTLKTDIEGALTYSWKDASNAVLGTTPTVIVKSPGTYTCTITNADGCFTTENIVVSEVSCSIQKGISPKGVGPGDGLNDS
ncbi:MAG: hypothetical protein O9262_13425, partial [Cyclobacteriaceae bacterium]|nr:hypothetical protein [Cyclobacteriaceae bacterium]